MPWTGGQYSLFRVLLGLGLFSQFLQSLIGTSWTSTHVAGFGLGSPFLHSLASSSALNVWLLVAILPVTILLVLGQRDRIAALLLILPSLMYLPGLTILAGLSPLTLILVLHLGTPPAPYGSLAAVNRVDPAGEWHMPIHISWLARILLALVTWAILFSLVPEGVRQTALFRFPFPSEGGWLLVLVAACASGLLLWLIPPLRRGLWWTLFFAGLIGMFSPIPSIVFGGWLLLCLSALPPWPPSSHLSEPELLFYDGSCGLCHRACRFVLAEDADGSRFTIAPLGGDTFDTLVEPAVAATLPDSMVLFDRTGKIHLQAAAVVHLLDRLGGYWRLAACIAKPMPLALTNRLYDFMAVNRFRWFDEPEEVCPLLPSHLRVRFKP